MLFPWVADRTIVWKKLRSGLSDGKVKLPSNSAMEQSASPNSRGFGMLASLSRLQRMAERRVSLSVPQLGPRDTKFSWRATG